MDELQTRRYRKLRHAILDRDLHLCQIRLAGCTRYATEVDHIIARADGGPMWDATNLRAACKGCNSRRSAERTNVLRYLNTQARYETRL